MSGQRTGILSDLNQALTSPPPPPLVPTHSYRNACRSGYAPEKVAENVQCEIMEVVAEEARLSYREEVVVSLPSNTLEDLESNVARAVAWVAAWERDNVARAVPGP